MARRVVRSKGGIILAKTQRSRRSPFRLGLFARINLSIVVLVIVVLLVVCILLTNSLVYPGLQKDQLLNAEAMEQLLNLTAQKYSSIFSQSKLLHSSQHVAERIAQLGRGDDLFFSYEDTRFLSDYLVALRYADDDILDAIIIPLNGGNRFSTSSDSARRISLSYDYPSLPEIETLLASDKNISITYSAEQPYVSSSNEQLITFAVKIFDPMRFAQMEPVGVMLINYPLSVFADAYQSLGALSGGSVYVVNRQMDIIFSTNEALLGQPYDGALEENAVVSRHLISTSGMQGINVMPQDYLRSATNGMVRSLLWILVPAMLLMTVFIYLCNRQYQKRIDDLATTMQNFRPDGSSLPLPVYRNDELGKLAIQFNEMCQRLNTQIDMHYKAEVGRKTAELNALQAQINPHFLFNTIEGIRMRAANNDDPDVAEMLMQLGRLFHWMIQLDKRIVYLEDEVEYNESYLNLQKLRYEDNFESQIDVQDEALYLGIPKFTLQPIIENALHHGLQENGLTGKIHVRVCVRGPDLVVQVSDNGSGMTPDTLLRLQRHITGQQEDNQFGIGMRNVHSRIQMLFGAAYGVSVCSEPDRGTVVTITLPAIAKKEMEQLIDHAAEAGAEADGACNHPCADLHRGRGRNE